MASNARRSNKKKQVRKSKPSTVAAMNAIKRARRYSSQKRMKGLKKKAHELSVLCGIDMCMVFYGAGARGEPEIWPDNPSHVRDMIRRFEETRESKKVKQLVGMEGFPEDKKKRGKKCREEEEKQQLREKGDEGDVQNERSQEVNPRYTWCAELGDCSEGESRILLCKLDATLLVLEEKLRKLRGGTQWLAEEAQEPAASSSTSDFLPSPFSSNN